MVMQCRIRIYGRSIFVRDGGNPKKAPHKEKKGPRHGEKAPVMRENPPHKEKKGPHIDIFYFTGGGGSAYSCAPLPAGAHVRIIPTTYRFVCKDNYCNRSYTKLV